MHVNDFAVFFVRSVSIVVAALGIPTAFVGACVGWHEMALAGCAATVIGGAVVTLTN